MSDIRNMTQLSRGSNKLEVTMVMQQMEVGEVVG
jgi:hypothetical protein